MYALQPSALLLQKDLRGFIPTLQQSQCFFLKISNQILWQHLDILMMSPLKSILD